MTTTTTYRGAGRRGGACCRPESGFLSATAAGLGSLCRFVVLASALAPAAFAGSLVIEGGTVHPVSGEPFEGSVLVVDGIIQAAGPSVEVPEGAHHLDASGLHVYPGVFDALSQLGLVEIGSVPATDDQTEMGEYNPHLRAATAVHPDSQVIPVARANGITHSSISPEADNDSVIVGQAALSHLSGWTVEEMAMNGSVAMVIRWPAIVTRSFDFSTFSSPNAVKPSYS